MTGGTRAATRARAAGDADAHDPCHAPHGLRVRVLFRAFARVRTSGLEQLPQHGPLIVVANHTTLVDPPFVAAWLQPALGRPLQFLAKEQLFTPALSPILRMYGAILVKAGGSDVEAYRAAVTVLRAGGVVAIFPEGTRSLDRRAGRRTTGRGAAGDSDGSAGAAARHLQH